METIAYKVSGTWTELSFTALGVGPTARQNLGTHGESKFILPLTTTPPETAQPIPFEAPCIIYTGRTGSGGSWSGGSILFQGRRTDNSGQASASSASQEIVIEDAWYDLRMLTYQTCWSNITSFSGTTPTYGPPQTWPDCVLFQVSPAGQLQPNGSYGTYSPAAVYQHITTGQTIYEILAYAIYIGSVNLQIGTLADCACYVPFYPIRSMRCSQALQVALRVHPDCTCEIDYTTTPPTFNIRKQANLTPVTLPYKSTSGARTHLTSSVRPRPELIPSRVGVYIKSTSTINGQSVVNVYTDIYPISAPSGLRSLDVSVDMTGPKLAKTQATLITAAFDPTSYNWWEQKVPAIQSTGAGGQVTGLSLLDATINGGLIGHPKGIRVVDNTGTPVNLSLYSYELVTGTPANWMQQVGGSAAVSTIDATVIAFFAYNKNTTAGAAALVDQIGEHLHSCRVKLINTASGIFSLSQTLATGETYPVGLAQAVYTALQTLQYNFTHTILESPFSTPLKPGKHALNLSGGAAAWATMAAMVQAVDYEYMYSPQTGLTTSKTTIHCGPVAHLDIGELIQIFNLFTNRDLSKINPSERSNGSDISGGQVTLGSDSPKENSVPAPSVASVLNVTSPDAIGSNITNILTHDATAAQITIAQHDTSVGTLLTTGLIPPIYNGAGSPTSSTLIANAYYRVNHLYLDTGANALWVCTTAGSNTSSVWAQLSGGASVRLRVKDDLGACLSCVAWDGTTEGTAFYVAKDTTMQNTISSYVENSITYTCSYTLTADSGSSGMHYLARAVSGSDGSSETDDIDPPYILNTEIWAFPIPVQTLSSQSCQLMDSNAGGRAWASR